MTCEKFIAESLALRTATHLAHLSSKSYARHVALGEFYEALTELIDQYAEVCMGLEGQITAWPRIALVVEDPVEMLEEYLLTVRDQMAMDDDSQALLNILAEIEELTARTLYKLKNLK